MSSLRRASGTALGFLFLASAAAVLPSCGGGSSSSEAGGGIGGTGGSVGAIAGFGSVVVNGVEFFTTPATAIELDGRSGGPELEGELRKGMYVRVRGTFAADGQTGTAERIVYEDAVEGVVESVDLPKNAFTVLSQPIVVDGTTVFEGTSGLDGAAPLAPGDRVEVSGPATAEGVLQALRVERKLPGEPSELTGRVTGLFAGEFLINGLPILASGALVQGTLAEGALVEVRSAAGKDPQGRLPVERVRVIAEDKASEGERVEFEGLARETPQGSGAVLLFQVEGQPVRTTEETRFDSGASDDILPNTRLEAEGRMSGGVLVAERIVFRRPRVKLEAAADRAGEANTGTVSVLGKTVRVNALTRLLSAAGPEAIAGGNTVAVRGYLDENGVDVVATRLELRDANPPSAVLLQGPVEGANAVEGAFVLLGIPVQTLPGATFRGADDAAVDRAEFFRRIRSGASLVKVRGTTSGSPPTILASEAELEN
jgi:hypothetical protein